jgi:hypothetical protein
LDFSAGTGAWKEKDVERRKKKGTVSSYQCRSLLSKISDSKSTIPDIKNSKRPLITAAYVIVAFSRLPKLSALPFSNNKTRCTKVKNLVAQRGRGEQI